MSLLGVIGVLAKNSDCYKEKDRAEPLDSYDPIPLVGSKELRGRRSQVCRPYRSPPEENPKTYSTLIPTYDAGQRTLERLHR